MASQLTVSFLLDPFQAFTYCQFFNAEDIERLKAESYLSATFWDIFDTLFYEASWQYLPEDIHRARAEYRDTEEKIRSIENGILAVSRQEIDEYVARCHDLVAAEARVMPLTANQRERLNFQAMLRADTDEHQITLPGDYDVYLDLRLHQIGWIV